MTALTAIFPDVDVLLAVATEELAYVLLKLSAEHQQRGLIHLQSILQQVNGSPNNSDGYPAQKRQEAELAISEAWNWLTVQGLLIQEPGINGNNGYMRLSRRAGNLVEHTAFEHYARSVAFPKSLLHPTIADAVWLDLARGDLETAVFKSLRAVEIAVREACTARS